MTDRASVALAALRKWDDLAPKCPFGCTSGSPTATTGGGSPASKQESPRSPNQPQRTASPPPARTPTAPVASDGIPPLLPPAQIAFGAEQMATHSHFVRLRTHVAERPRSKTLAVNASQVTVAESLQPIENIPAPVCYLVSSTQRYKDSAVDSFCPSLTCGDARACGAAAEDDYRAAILRETGEGQRKSDAEPTPVLNKKERAIAAMRSVVSQNKIRFQEDGFDLDLTYITPRIIAMGFPSTGRESYFRNPMPEVERFFAKRHPNHFRVYNLCCEREYDAPSRFGGRHRRFPFEDHNAPNDVALIPGLIKDAVDFLKEDDDNVVAIHCKAGKGRTGLMVSCLLMATEPELRDPQKALDYFSDVRTNDSQGVTIPSQKRYVGYWGQLMADYGSAAPKDNRRLYLNRLTITSFIKAKMAAPLDVYFIVHHGTDDIFDSRKTQFGSSGAKLWAVQKNAYVFDFITAAPVTAADDDGALAKANANNTQLSQRSLEFSVSGDVKFTVFSKNKLMADEELFHFWFNSTLCEYPSLRISKFDLDGGPNKDKKHSHYAENLAVEFVFEAPQWMASRQARDQQAQSAGQEGSAKKKESGGFFSRVFGSKK